MAYPNAGLPNDLGDYDETAAQTAAQVRETPRRSPQNLGGDARYNQVVQEQFRALRGQLEDHLGGAQLQARMPICAWLARHSAFLLSR